MLDPSLLEVYQKPSCSFGDALISIKEELLKKDLNVIDGYDVSKDGKWR